VTEQRTRTGHTDADGFEAARDARFGELDHIRIDTPRHASVLRVADVGPVALSIAGWSKVHVTGRRHAVARDHADVFASRNAAVDAYDHARVIGVDAAVIHASDHASVEAHDNTRVVLTGTATGYVRDRCRAVARDQARLEAHGSSTISGHEQARLSVHDQAKITAAPARGSLVVYGDGVRHLDRSGRLVPLPGRIEPAPCPDPIAL
jgi:hypothetical protein